MAAEHIGPCHKLENSGQTCIVSHECMKAIFPFVLVGTRGVSWKETGQIPRTFQLATNYHINWEAEVKNLRNSTCTAWPPLALWTTGMQRSKRSFSMMTGAHRGSLTEKGTGNPLCAPSRCGYPRDAPAGPGRGMRQVAQVRKTRAILLHFLMMGAVTGLHTNHTNGGLHCPTCKAHACRVWLISTGDMVDRSLKSFKDPHISPRRTKKLRESLR